MSDTEKPPMVPIDSDARGVEIRATKFRRFLTIAAHKVLSKIPQLRIHVTAFMVFFPFGIPICIKCNKRGRLVEANTMEYVRQHTSIPVPKVYCAFRRKGKTYIVMKRIKGENICLRWPDYRSSDCDESKAKVFGQLRKMMDELRSLPGPDTGGPRNLLGGPLWEMRLHTQPNHAHDECGPFETMEDFHLHLRAGWDGRKLRGFGRTKEADFKNLLRMHRNGTWSLKLSHGDLNCFNVLVRGDNVVGIIDWETAGWYPSYWEYTQAMTQLPLAARTGGGIMTWSADKFLEPFPEEHEMELNRLFFHPYDFYWDGSIDQVHCTQYGIPD